MLCSHKCIIISNIQAVISPLLIFVHVYRTLDILADRKDMSCVTGDIMVNGAKKPSNFKRMTGYVVQVLYTVQNVVRCMFINIPPNLK